MGLFFLLFCLSLIISAKRFLPARIFPACVSSLGIFIIIKGLARLQQMEELKLWLCTKAEQAQVKEPEKSTELMENMAQLWLQQEVRDLENQEKYSSSYLVVDASALIHHLFAVKDILATKKFAIIVPNSGKTLQ